jgi:hypothetical protein
LPDRVTRGRACTSGSLAGRLRALGESAQVLHDEPADFLLAFALAQRQLLEQPVLFGVHGFWFHFFEIRRPALAHIPGYFGLVVFVRFSALSSALFSDLYVVFFSLLIIQENTLECTSFFVHFYRLFPD